MSMRLLFITILLTQLNRAMENQSTCVICSDEFAIKTKCGEYWVTTSFGVVRKTSCGHDFHRECINEWVRNKPSCPLCRSDLTSQKELNDLLINAVKIGPEAEMKKLIFEGAEVNAFDELGWAPIHYAAYYRKQRSVGILVENGAEINANTLYGFKPTALHIAVNNNDEAMVRLLVAHNASVDARDHNNDTPLIYGAAQIHVNIVRFLIKSGAFVDHFDNQGWTALDTAASYGHSTIVKIILEEDLDLQFQISSLEKAQTLASGDKTKKMLKKYLQVPLSHRQTKLNNFFMAAAEESDVSRVHSLIAKGADINCVDQLRQTRLMIAAKRGDVNILKLLLDKGADPTLMNHIGKTALDMAKDDGCRVLFGDHYKTWINNQFLAAVRNNKVFEIHSLIAKGAEIDCVDEAQRTPLMNAAQNGNVNIVEFLLDNGADPTFTNHGRTALDMTTDYKCRVLLGDDDKAWLNKQFLATATINDVCKVHSLILDGAEIDSIDELGQTALHKAIHIWENEFMVEKLLKHKPNVNIQCKYGQRTPLMIAAEKGNWVILKLLLKNGANDALRNYEGKTAFDLATDYICRYLLRTYKAGLYVVHHDGAIVGDGLPKTSNTVRRLKLGDVVNVVEVIENFEESRVRGRINDGWISLLNTSTGYRWAVPKEENEERRCIQPYENITLSDLHHMRFGEAMENGDKFCSQNRNLSLKSTSEGTVDDEELSDGNESVEMQPLLADWVLDLMYGFRDRCFHENRIIQEYKTEFKDSKEKKNDFYKPSRWKKQQLMKKLSGLLDDEREALLKKINNQEDEKEKSYNLY